MKEKNILVAFLVTAFPFLALGVTPVHVGTMSVDTSMYRIYDIPYLYYAPDPFTDRNLPQSVANLSGAKMIVQAFLKKNSNQVDFYSFNGKIGTSTIPILLDSDKSIYSLNCSRGIIDDDDGWEILVSYSKNQNYVFTLFDNDGTEILADSGTNPFYGFDGNNTYVLVQQAGYMSFDCWRFRTNITSAAPHAVAKTTASSPLPMMAFGSGGDYRISFEPSAGGKTTVQLFDMLGKQIFLKTFDEITRPMSFTIPESGVPRTPFVAKVRNETGTTVRREIPVR